jgi:RNA ligase
LFKTIGLFLFNQSNKTTNKMNLASIQKVIKLTPIEGADLIETATVLGWEIVIKKGEYNIGDLCTYIQIDTIVPDKPEFEFLRERKFRVRTIKLRKQISQGLLVPVPAGKWKEGDDVSEIIGVKKYDKPDNNPDRSEKPRMPKSGIAKWIYLFKYNFLFKLFPFLEPKTRSSFPKHLVSITDEERIQNIPQVLEKYAGKTFVVSYKLDGSSITIIHNKVLGISKFRICSRRFELHDKRNDWYKVFVATNFAAEIAKLVAYFKTDDIIVQGEAIGKFNGNHHQLKQDEIRLFNILVDGKRISQGEFIDVCTTNNIPHCPMYTTIILQHTLPEIIKLSEIKDVLNPTVEAEGLVWRCVEDNLSFKVINNKFLLKNNE